MHGRTTRRWLLGAATLVSTLSACTAQSQLGNTVGQPQAQASPSAMPWVDMSKLPAPGRSIGTPSTMSASTPMKVDPDNVGAFRTHCVQSHMAADDPIVAPGQPGATHLHTFFGNTGTNASSTAASIATSGSSSCNGGTLNRTAYWMPSLIDTTTGTPVNANKLLVYYKSGYNGITREQIQPFPAGLRMIAGRAKATASDPQVRTAEQIFPIAQWTCAGTGGPASASIPANCGPGNELVASVRFPQCWDGVNLDSADHMSHMSYTVGPAGGGQCPATHPVAVPEISMMVHFTVPAGGPAPLRLSSDMYDGGAGGFSLHADWFEGWDPATMATWVNNCVKNLDCGVDFLGDGRRLNGVVDR